MSFASFLVVPKTGRGQSGFTFDHDQHHRNLALETATHNYLFDPTYDTNLPSTLWHLNHQLSHDAVSNALGGPPVPILKDSNLKDPKALTWWTFINNQQHYAIDQKLLLR